MSDRSEGEGRVGLDVREGLDSREEAQWEGSDRRGQTGRLDGRGRGWTGEGGGADGREGPDREGGLDEKAGLVGTG